MKAFGWALHRPVVRELDQATPEARPAPIERALRRDLVGFLGHPADGPNRGRPLVHPADQALADASP